MAYCLPFSLANHESSQSWRELFGQLKHLGLFGSPKLVIDDGSLGFWVALQEEYGPINSNVCWVHKTANILDKVPELKSRASN
jgi:putative transposase